MEERKEERHLQGMRNVLLAFAFCFVCALFVGVSPVYAAKQECDYKITEADQDFITWFKANMYGSERLKQYVYIRSMGDSWSVVSSDRPLRKIKICITKISTFLILCDLAVCLATLYVSFSLVFALMRYLQGKVFLIRFYSPTTLSSSRAEFRLPSRLACA